MSELIDRRPVLTLVMGCDGVGKSTWKRMNFDHSPDRYFDQDSIASGIGGWDKGVARERARVYVDGEIKSSFEQRLDFGLESSFSDLQGSELMDRAIEEGYRMEGLYIGTESPEINITRINHRVLT